MNINKVEKNLSCLINAFIINETMERNVKKEATKKFHYPFVLTEIKVSIFFVLHTFHLLSFFPRYMTIVCYLHFHIHKIMKLTVHKRQSQMVRFCIFCSFVHCSTSSIVLLLFMLKAPRKKKQHQERHRKWKNCRRGLCAADNFFDTY